MLRPPAAAPAAAGGPGRWVPGMVELQLRDDVAAEVALEAAGGEALASAAGVDMGSVQEVLQRHLLQRAEPSFRIPAEEAASALEAAVAPDPGLPNVRNYVTLYFPADADVQAIAQELAGLPEVERAVPVPRAIPPQTALATPLDEPLVGDGDRVVLNPGTGLENQWYLFRCAVHEAWRLSTGAGVVIADIDWGYRVTHQDLAPRLDLTRAHNSFDGGTNVSHGSDLTHGTAVLGIAGAADNDRGMAGIAPMAALWPIQANSGPGQPLAGNSWANAIDWVRRTDSGGRRKVIVLEVQTGSFGNYEQLPSVSAAIRMAIASGVVVCVAAGNGDRHAGIDDQGHPFAETGSILVGATMYHSTANRRASFSNFGPSVVVCAPGDADHDLTCSVQADDSYQNPFGGTSGATPKVAGTAALMLAVNPLLTHADVREILHTTGSPVESAAGKPVGRFLNAAAAVREAIRRRDAPSNPGGGETLPAQPTQTALVEAPVQLDEPQPLPPLPQVSSLIRVRQARETFEVDGSGLTAAVLDTGLRTTHIDFAGRVRAQRNFTQDNGGNPENATDGQGHGTNVAGIVAANGDHVGIAPGAGVIPLKVLSNGGGGSFDAIADALQWVLDHHAEHNITAVCMSLGDSRNHTSDQFAGDSLRDRIEDLRERRIAVVIAAGNDYFTHGSRQGMAYPGILRSAVSVGAVYDAVEGGFRYQSGAEAFATAPDRITPFSQRLHESVNADLRTDIFAPGAPVTSAGINNDHGESVQQGTSQATPVTVGVILLMQQLHLQATGELPSVDDLTTWLRNSGAPIVDGDDEDDNVEHTGLGFLRIDAFDALDAVRRHLLGVVLETGAALR